MLFAVVVLTSAGKGRIGLECFRGIVNDPRLRGIPLILETPSAHDDSDEAVAMYRSEIALLRGLVVEAGRSISSSLPRATTTAATFKAKAACGEVVAKMALKRSRTDSATTARGKGRPAKPGGDALESNLAPTQSVHETSSRSGRAKARKAGHTA